MNKKINEFKRKLIIETAHKYFELHGYTGVQINIIAKELEIGVGTIYSMFGSKEGLFLACFFSLVEKAYEDVKTEFESEKNPISKCVYFVKYKLSYYEKKKSILRDYMQNNQLFLKNASRRKENPMRKIYDLVADAIKEIVKTNKVECQTQDYYLLAYLLDSITNSYIERFSEDENVNFATKTEEVIQMFLNTIGARELKYEV